MDLARAPRRAPLTARKMGSGYENGAMHREAEHPSSTHARKRNWILINKYGNKLSHEENEAPGHDLEPRFCVKALYFHIYWSK
jgi:hypothetical protein